jgi:hypothetical protein
MAKGFFADIRRKGEAGPAVRITVTLTKKGVEDKRILVMRRDQAVAGQSVLLSGEIIPTLIEGLPEDLEVSVRWSND